ncbi:MAG: Na/Pi symporter, partial [Anaerotignum sp.]|nr:Na/Pi symporter [Anaerotignum sp.]
MTLYEIFGLLGGVGLFLYGMSIMSTGLRNACGEKLKTILEYSTKNKYVSVLVGIAVTMLIQSSSATDVMVIGFVNSGLMNLFQAIGVIMGANIGTTITAWLVSMSEWGSMLKPEFFAPLLIGIGAFGMLFAKKEKAREL